MSNQIVKFETSTGLVELSPQIIKQYLVNGDVDKVTNQEVHLFLELCKYRQLNPFLKETHLIKYGNQPAQLVVAYDTFISRAEQNPKYQGFKSGVSVVNQKGELFQREGALRLPNEQVVGGWCEVYKEGYKNPIRIDVTFDEYAGYKSNGELNMNWAKKPAFMITKVAEGQAHRKAFPNDFKGMYLEEENAPIASANIETFEVVEETISHDEVKKLVAHAFNGAKDQEHGKAILKQALVELDLRAIDDDFSNLQLSKLTVEEYEKTFEKINEIKSRQ